MHGSVLQSRGLTLANEHLGSPLSHPALHALSHQVTCQSALSLSQHALGQLATCGSRQPITPGITSKSKRTTSHVLPEARLILLISHILQPVLIVRLNSLASNLTHNSVTQTSLHDVLSTTLRHHTLNLQLVQFILKNRVDHRLKLLRITTQSAIQAISLHHLICRIAHIIQELRISVELTKLLLQTREHLCRILSLVCLILSTKCCTQTKISRNKLASFHSLRKCLTACLLSLVVLIHYRWIHILIDNARKSIIDVLVHQSVLNMLIMRIEACSNTLSDVTIVRTIFVHQTLHHSRLQEQSHIVIIADTHVIRLLLQLILHAMAIPLRFNTLLSILHSIIRQRRYHLVGNVHSRSVSISAQSRLHHAHSLLIAVGSTISQQVGNHILKVIALLIRSLLPVLNIVGKFGIHQALIIHHCSRCRNLLFRFRRSHICRRRSCFHLNRHFLTLYCRLRNCWCWLICSVAGLNTSRKHIQCLSYKPRLLISSFLLLFLRQSTSHPFRKPRSVIFLWLFSCWLRYRLRHLLLTFCRSTLPCTLRRNRSSHLLTIARSRCSWLHHHLIKVCLCSHIIPHVLGLIVVPITIFLVVQVIFKVIIATYLVAIVLELIIEILSVSFVKHILII